MKTSEILRALGKMSETDMVTLAKMIGTSIMVKRIENETNLAGLVNILSNDETVVERLLGDYAEYRDIYYEVEQHVEAIEKGHIGTYATNRHFILDKIVERYGGLENVLIGDEESKNTLIGIMPTLVRLHEEYRETLSSVTTAIENLQN